MAACEHGPYTHTIYCYSNLVQTATTSSWPPLLTIFWSLIQHPLALRTPGSFYMTKRSSVRCVSSCLHWSPRIMCEQKISRLGADIDANCKIYVVCAISATSLYFSRGLISALTRSRYPTRSGVGLRHLRLQRSTEQWPRPSQTSQFSAEVLSRIFQHYLIFDWLEKGLHPHQALDPTPMTIASVNHHWGMPFWAPQDCGQHYPSCSVQILPNDTSHYYLCGPSVPGPTSYPSANT